MPEIPPVPPALQAVHDTIRKYGNTTVAHSQSGLVMPLALAILNDEGQGYDVRINTHAFDALRIRGTVRRFDRRDGGHRRSGNSAGS